MTTLSETVQTEAVVEANLTASVEVEVALIVTGDALRARLPSGPKLIVWAALATLKLCVTFGAAPKPAFPGWLAVMEQVPAPTMVTVEPDTVQTAEVVDAKLTGRLEDAVAVSVIGAAP